MFYHTLQRTEAFLEALLVAKGLNSPSVIGIPQFRNTLTVQDIVCACSCTTCGSNCEFQRSFLVFTSAVGNIKHLLASARYILLLLYANCLSILRHSWHTWNNMITSFFLSHLKYIFRSLRRSQLSCKIFKKNVYFFLKLTCLSVKYVWFWQGCEKCVDIAGWGEAGAEGTVTAYILWFPIYLCGEKWEKRDVRKRLSARKQADKEVTVAYWSVILEVLREMNQFDSKSPPLVA